MINKKSFQNGYFAIKKCRHGYFAYNTNDSFVGKSLDLYGEWTEHEIEVLTPLLAPGDVVLDVGAYIGTHSIPFAKAVSPGGVVYAIEAQRTALSFLHTNIALNNLTNIICINKFISDKERVVKSLILDQRIQQNFGSFKIKNMKGGEIIKTTTVDKIKFPKNKRVKLIKIDVEGDEIKVLHSAKNTIKKHNPFIYVECSTKDRKVTKEIITYLTKLKYIPYWHYFKYFNENNFFKNKRDIFARIHPEVNLICFPKTIKVIQNVFVKVNGPDDTWRKAHKRRLKQNDK